MATRPEGSGRKSGRKLRPRTENMAGLSETVFIFFDFRRIILFRGKPVFFHLPPPYGPECCAIIFWYWPIGLKTSHEHGRTGVDPRLLLREGDTRENLHGGRVTCEIKRKTCHQNDVRLDGFKHTETTCRSILYKMGRPFSGRAYCAHPA